MKHFEKVESDLHKIRCQTREDVEYQSINTSFYQAWDEIRKVPQKVFGEIVIAISSKTEQEINDKKETRPFGRKK